jgi:hypothetical protein
MVPVAPTMILILRTDSISIRETHFLKIPDIQKELKLRIMR